MEKFIVGGILILIIYQIYSTHKNVTKLVNQIEELKDKIDSLNK